MIVVLGASGFIAQAFLRSLDSRNERYFAVSRSLVDYYDPIALSKLLFECDAEFLINAAGYSGRPNVDACEDDKTECLIANGC